MEILSMNLSNIVQDNSELPVQQPLASCRLLLSIIVILFFEDMVPSIALIAWLDFLHVPP